MSQPSLTYILSLPRSGSTVLTALLDKCHGVVSPPESSFPQVLGVTSAAERKQPRWLAALYIGATFPPTPLSLDDAEACMHGTDKEILVALGMAVAGKLGRPLDQVKNILWKTPRTIGFHETPLASGGNFIIIRRNPHNVFESQFRVEFGTNNRNPYRFAIFRESYEHAFSRLPADRCHNLEYDDLPGAIPELLRFMGIENQGEWEVGESSLDAISKSVGWMADVTKKFENKDVEKRARLDVRQVNSLNRAMALARPLRPLMGPLRSHFDHKSLQTIRERARLVLSEAG